MTSKWSNDQEKLAEARANPLTHCFICHTNYGSQHICSGTPTACNTNCVYWPTHQTDYVTEFVWQKDARDLTQAIKELTAILTKKGKK